MNLYKNPLSIALNTLGTLFILAMVFDLMTRKYALFAGIACYVIAGAVRKIMR